MNCIVLSAQVDAGDILTCNDQPTVARRYTVNDRYLLDSGCSDAMVNRC